MLSDDRSWPDETAPLSVRARVMSRLAERRQADPRPGPARVTLYRAGTGWPRRRLMFSLRPPLAAAAAIAVIVSAAIYAMGGLQAWDSWAPTADIAAPTRPTQTSPTFAVLPAQERQSDAYRDLGRQEAEALFTDVARFRAHVSDRLPRVDPAPVAPAISNP
ncbi:MAG: hypothetical protein AAFX79_10835 [Planctomycetota bacterium]